MARPNVFVSGIREIGTEPVTGALAAALADTPHVAVTLGDGVTGLLDMTDRRSAIWREVLESLRAAGRPAYVEVDPETRLITEVLQPIPFVVTGIAEEESGLRVELQISQALHRLDRSNPDYDELAALLRAAYESGATVLVTESPNDNDIVDVRLQAPGEREE